VRKTDMRIVTRDASEFTVNIGLLPQPGTATVVPGIGVFLETSVIQELIDAPDSLERLRALLEAVEGLASEYNPPTAK
jgi:hypothetical protein